LRRRRSRARRMAIATEALDSRTSGRRLQAAPPARPEAGPKRP
jgi:hypothetical protein